MSKICLKSLTLPVLEKQLADSGQPAFRARQVFRWTHYNDVACFAEMTSVSKKLRSWLKEEYHLLRLPVAARQTSEDGTQKFALSTPDGHLIECVLIPEPRRLTLCISTQIGCRFGCTFCRTGTMGLIRNLTAGEIIEQIYAVQREEPKRRITNVVLMGMGEPLDNLDNVIDAIRILQADHGFNLSPRKITLSTAGIPPAMERLGKAVEISLAVSLHAPDDETRDLLMPLNRKYPLASLIEACRQYPHRPRRRITFEYALIKDVNDSPEHAKRLAELVQPVRPKINLIACNPFAESGFSAPSDETVLQFQQILIDRNLTVIVRKPRGRDILAACGQLATQEKNE